MVQVSRLPEDVKEFVLDMRKKQIKKGIQNDAYNARLPMRSHVTDCIDISRLSRVHMDAFWRCQVQDYGRIRKLIQAKKKVKENKIKRGDTINNKERIKYKGDFQTYPERVQDLILCERRLNSIHGETNYQNKNYCDINNMLYWIKTRQGSEARREASNLGIYDLLKERINKNLDLPHK